MATKDVYHIQLKNRKKLPVVFEIRSFLPFISKDLEVIDMHIV
jgi:hypothetical protein